jgi:putative transposase
MELPDGKVRKKRVAHDLPGHVHELTWSCYRRLPLLSKDRTRQWLLDAIDRSRAIHRFDLYAYVLMPEHVHLLIRPREMEYEIAAILKSIKQAVARRAVNHLRESAPEFLQQIAITWPNGRVEHRFWQQGGGYDRNITEPKTLGLTIEYIHNNPVRRVLVAAPTDWEWSSARWYAGYREGTLPIDDVGSLMAGVRTGVS